MTGGGGMGSLPSSRLTRILQEKAEALKKRKVSAEAALKSAEDAGANLDAVGVTLSETTERLAKLHELARKSDWEAVETEANELLAYVGKSVGPPLEERRQLLAGRVETLRADGAPLPDDAPAIVAAAMAGSIDAGWAPVLTNVARLDRLVRTSQTDLSQRLRTDALGVAQWSGEADHREGELDRAFRAALEPIAEGDISGAIGRLADAIRTVAPKSVERHSEARARGTALLAVARDLGAGYQNLADALTNDEVAPPTRWPTTVPAIDSAGTQIGEELRERVVAAVEALQRTLKSLSESGTDTSESVVQIEQTLGRIPGASPDELPGLLAEARQVTEEPVVAVVAGLLDEVRPRLVEARRLGRDATEVFAAMNRAREALRLKIYSEALAASQEAIDRVTQITGDLDGLREEADSLRTLVDRLDAVRFPVEAYREPLARATTEIERVQVDAARTTLRETVRALGRDAVQHFRTRLAALERVIEAATDRGFAPDGSAKQLAKARRHLEEGELSEAGEEIAQLDVSLRAAAGPYVARRVEEIEKGFEEIPESQLVAPARRLLADADVNLRVKEDIAGSLESLKRAEREFSAVFAAHASSLVEALEEERRTLESMGGAGDEIQRQIDEVQQIFNMGDFVKASRASQEIRTRAQQQQLLRSEEAVSHAKLALVELGKMGLEAADLKTRFEGAQEAAREHRFADAYTKASAVEQETLKLHATAQEITDGLARATQVWQALKDDGVLVDPYRERIRAAKQAYAQMDFPAARSTLADVAELLEAERAKHEASVLLAECHLLIEDARRLSVPEDVFERKVTEAHARLDAGAGAEALPLAKDAHTGLIRRLRPVLEEHVKSVERDLEVARSAGVEVRPIVESLAEARRRLAAPVPTGVAEGVDAARAQLLETRGFLEHAERAVKRARDAFAEAELVRAGPAATRERLEGLERHLKDREYARTIEDASTVERELTQLTHQHVARTLAGFQGLLVHARQEGSDTAVAENLLTQARQALDEGRPLEALALATKSESEIERVELQTRIARGSLEMIEGKVAQAEKDGIKAPVAAHDATRARTAYDHREFPKVLELAIEASDALTISRESYRRSRESLEAADREVKEALELGADVQEVVKVLDAARHHAQAGEYPESTRRAREATEKARWAIERLYSGSLTEVRALIATMQDAGIASGVEKVLGPLEAAEVALKAREWRTVTDQVERARAHAVQVLEQVVDERLQGLDRMYGTGAISEEETANRSRVRAQVAAERERRTYAQALALLKEEVLRVQDLRKQVVARRITDLRDRLWVGEKLGLDTTPVMETFSEAKQALDAGRTDSAEGLVKTASESLANLVGPKLSERLRDVLTELNFAREGLHVTLGALPERLQTVESLRAEHHVLEAARMLLDAEEELNRRKALHRELMNIHYLIDAALARAAERRIDAAEARKLLDESIQARSTDYAQALEKAREALKLLQGQLKSTEAPTAFWPFRRTPPSG